MFQEKNVSTFYTLLSRFYSVEQTKVQPYLFMPPPLPSDKNAPEGDK